MNIHCAGLMLVVCTRRAPPCEQQSWFCMYGSLAFTVTQYIVQVQVLNMRKNGQTYSPIQPDWLPGVCKFPSFLDEHPASNPYLLGPL